MLPEQPKYGELKISLIPPNKRKGETQHTLVRQVFADKGTTSFYDSRPDTYEHIESVRLRLMGVVVRLIERASLHDASKLEEPELSVFNEYTPKLRDSTYGSDEYNEFLNGMAEGLVHHYAHNDHHPEHHADGIHGMDLIQMTEMLADWKAATTRHADGDLRRSIEQNAERFGYGDEIKRLLLNTAESMGWI